MKRHIIAAYWQMINDRVCVVVVVVAPPAGSASAPHGLLIGNGNDGDSQHQIADIAVAIGNDEC
jgi:phage terminase large subunit-like protein